MQMAVCKNQWDLITNAVLHLTLAPRVDSSMKNESGNCGRRNQQRLRNLPFEKQQE
jgi:hypothetical protein